MFNKTWFIWLLLVCIWNFGWPKAAPLADILVAALLSIVIQLYKNKK